MDGPYVVVEQRVRNAERVSCPACIGIASRQRNRLDGFCELWGSKSQCDRAEPIRRRTLSQVDVLAYSNTFFTNANCHYHVSVANLYDDPRHADCDKAKIRQPISPSR